MRGDKLIAGLDIGTTKVAVVVAELTPTGSFKVLGIGTAPAEGLKRGVIVDLEKAIESVRQALDSAEEISGRKIESAFVGIAGDHIRSINSRGVIAVGKNNTEIMISDVQRALDAAKAVAIPADREIIHILPQEYTVDEQSGIKDPVGFSGMRLEVDVHVVTGSVASIQNNLKCIEKAGLEVDELVLEPLASSYAVLSPDEMDLGCVVIDMGGGTTDLTVFHDGAVKHTAVVGIGGKNVTSDLAIGLRTPLEQAEQLKCKYGCALSSLVDAAEMITVPGVVGREAREVSRSVLASIIEPRMEEIFSLVARELKKGHSPEMLAAGVILTGGASQICGAVELAEQIFDLPTKVSAPMLFENAPETRVGPEHATGVGLIHFALSRHDVSFRRGRPHGVTRTFEKIKRWINEYF